jgi:hypothetical protein
LALGKYILLRLSAANWAASLATYWNIVKSNSKKRNREYDKRSPVDRYGCYYAGV